MPSPSPSPSSPPPSASFSQEPTTGSQELTHLGHAAGPSLPCFLAFSRRLARATETSHDQSHISNLDNNVPTARAIVDEDALAPFEITVNENLHETLAFQQDSFHDQRILPQGPNHVHTVVSHNHVQEVNGYTQNPEAASLNSASMSLTGGSLTFAQDSQYGPISTQPDPQQLDYPGYHEQAASWVPPSFDIMGNAMANAMFGQHSTNISQNMAMGQPMANMMFQHPSTGWGQTAMGGPQTFQNQNEANPVNFMPLHTQGHNFWAHDPTRMMQSQMTAAFAPPVPTAQVVQRTPCYWPSCTESFTRATDIPRHVDSVHLGIRFHCFWAGCSNNGGRGYSRAEKLRDHQKKKHGSA